MERDFPGFEVGALPPLGPDLPPAEVVDVRLLYRERLLCSAGDHRHSLAIDPRDLVRVVEPVGRHLRAQELVARQGLRSAAARLIAPPWRNGEAENSVRGTAADPCVQWGLRAMGGMAGLMLDKPGLALVAAALHRPGNAGRDLGDVLGSVVSSACRSPTSPRPS
jgi:hypothetical protein